MDAPYDYAAEIADAREHGDEPVRPTAAEIAQDEAEYAAEQRRRMRQAARTKVPCCPHGRMVCTEGTCDRPF